MASLPGLAALVALVFTWVSVGQTGTQLRIAEQGQITSRFNEAVSHLGSESLDLRFGGIYALERIMQDSPRDQPRIISVLSAYVRTHTPVPTDGFPKMKPDDVLPPVDADVIAVAEVLAARPLGQDGQAEINWQSADLRGLLLQPRYGRSGDAPPVSFGFANLSGADLRQALFSNVDLNGSWCMGVNLAHAFLTDVNLKNAFLQSADLTSVELEDTSLRGADLSEAVLVGANLVRVDLRDATLDQADLSGADLYGANLRGADLGGSDLRRANLTGADLTGADLTGALLDGAKGVPADVLDR
ncbi:pentapeptide repeat-containing protein [Streptomyces sp. NPDC020858]|uniref:pentapeptide repeat-containing protein n=1 Tax=Streptomyces sp. NPDC020858 TaxID=3365097 RepID=UPI00379C0460